MWDGVFAGTLHFKETTALGVGLPFFGDLLALQVVVGFEVRFPWKDDVLPSQPVTATMKHGVTRYLVSPTARPPRAADGRTG